MRRGLLPILVAATVLFAGCVNPFVSQGDRTGPGQRAHDYLGSKPYATILVELDYVQGAAPEDQAISLLTQRLHDATGKSVDVVKTASVKGQGSGHKYTLDEIAVLEASNRAQFSSGSQAVLYMLYLDGGFVEDTSQGTVLAAAYRGSSVVVFKQNLRDASCTSNCVNLPTGIGNTKPPIAKVEGPVVVHEMGHILGLVNNGIPMQTPHEDSDAKHKGHSSDQNSVMYWAIESSAITSFFGQTPPDDFDGNDRSDLQAARSN